MSIRRAVLAATAIAALLGGCTTTDDDAGTAVEPPAAADEADGTGEVADDDAVGDAAADDAGDGEADDGPRTFAAGEDIPVEVSWLASDDGGRRTGVFGGYRGTLTFADHDPMPCTVGGPAEGGSMEPGTTHEVAVTCPEDVTVAPDEVTFTVEEGGRLVGDGTVLP